MDLGRGVGPMILLKALVVVVLYWAMLQTLIGG